jgi:hypothetical protein
LSSRFVEKEARTLARCQPRLELYEDLARGPWLFAVGHWQGAAETPDVRAAAKRAAVRIKPIGSGQLLGRWQQRQELGACLGVASVAVRRRIRRQDLHRQQLARSQGCPLFSAAHARATAQR